MRLAGHACSLPLVVLEDRELPFKMQPSLDSLHIYDFYGDVCLYDQVYNNVKCDLRGQLQSHAQNTLILDNHQDCGKQNRAVTLSTVKLKKPVPLKFAPELLLV